MAHARTPLKAHRLLPATLLLLAVPCGLHVEASAQGNRWVNVVGGPVVLAVGSTGIVAGQDPLPVSNDASGLEWRTGPNNQKITVGTSAPGQSFGLRIEAISVAGMGGPQGVINLVDGMFAQDLLRNLNTTPGPANGSCTLRYTAVVTIEQGNSSDFGDDLHLVTFTLTDQ